MLGWLAGGVWAWALWHWLGLHADLSAQGLWMQELAQRLALGGSLHTWDLPPCFSLLPDLGLLKVLRGLGPDPERIQRWFGFLLGLLAWKYLARLLRGLGGLQKGPARVLSAAGLVLGLALAPLPGLEHWMVPGEHGSSLVLALAAWAWGLRQKDRPSGRLATLVAATLLGLVGASDPWALLWTLPVLAALAWRCRREAWPRLAAGLLLSLALAWWGRRLLVGLAGRVVEPDWGRLAAFDGVAWRAQAGLLGLAWAPAAGFALLGLGLWLWPLASRSSAWRVLGLGWWMAALGSLWVGFSLGLSGAGWAFLMLPLLWLLPALLVERWPAWGKPILLGLGLWVLFMPSGAIPARPSLAEQCRWMQASLGPQRRYGWASPALARGLRLASGGALVLEGVLPQSEGPVVLAWCADRALLSDGAAVHRPQFVVLPGLDETWLRAQLGSPRAVMQGQGLKIWLLEPTYL